MKALVKIMLVLALFFASTFIIIKSTGLITLDKIEMWLEVAKSANPIYVATFVALFLFADLFIAIPTLSVMLLSGYFLGPVLGAFAAIAGVLLAGVCGYWISFHYGDTLIRFLVKDSDKQLEAKAMFQQHGSIVILLSRATPILPEVSACMAGMSNMSFLRFLALWLVSTVPYACIAAYAGSISTVNDPRPAIFTAIGLTAIFWLGWFVFKRVNSGGMQRK